MGELVALDSNWLREHPLPKPSVHADKNARGRVFILGGCRHVPGGLLLTAEAALRAGAGKVQAATGRSITLPLGMAMPEIAVFPLDEDDEGEIAALDASCLDLIMRSDAIVVGPAMGDTSAASMAVKRICTLSSPELILDAAALMSLPSHATALSSRRSPAVLTPHLGEMAAMLECDADEIEADREGAVLRAASLYGAVVILKGSTSVIADRDGALFAYAGGGVGLATGGSGDVMAGLVAGLIARGAMPLDATLWAVWLHGEAGRQCGTEIGPLGFLARELLRHVPGLMSII